MNFINKKSKLSDVISDNTQVIPVINRFGIKLGTGELTIEEVSKNNDIDAEFLLLILNTYIDENFFPEKRLKEFDIVQIINYLQKSDTYLYNTQLVNLEKHLRAFISMNSSINKKLNLIIQVFDELKFELQKELKEGIIMQGDSACDLLIEIKSILIKHISGDFNENMCYAVIFSTDAMIRDLERHNRIRTKILHPMINKLKEEGRINSWRDLTLCKNAGDENEITDKNELTKREIEVLRLIALGLMNKEIAEKLNISLNTVLTHRKNLSSKLSIKTVSGLVFYCISNNYISADEIAI